MTCLHCAKNRAVRATDGFYSARCRRGYPHQDEGCAGFVGRSTCIEEEGSESSLPRVDQDESCQNLS